MTTINRNISLLRGSIAYIQDKVTEATSLADAVTDYYHYGDGKHALDTLVQVDADLNHFYGYEPTHALCSPDELTELLTWRLLMLLESTIKAPKVDPKIAIKVEKEVDRMFKFLSAAHTHADDYIVATE